MLPVTLYSSSTPEGSMGNPRSHHALKQALPVTDIVEHFGSAEPKEIAREVNRLGQRELQARAALCRRH